MIALDDAARKAIDTARGLSVTMIDQGWGTVYVSCADGEFFLSRQAGKVDPLSPAAVAPVATPAVAAPASVAPAALPAIEVKAPHVATVVSLAPVGSEVQAGQAIATLRVLDETIEVAAAAAGTVLAHVAQPGALAEYGNTLVTLQP